MSLRDEVEAIHMKTSNFQGVPAKAVGCSAQYHNLIEKMESFSEDKQTVVNNLVKDLEKL